MARKDDFKRIFGVDLEETPETLGYHVSSVFMTEVVLMMKRKGMTLADLARAMKIEKSSLCEMLNGKSNLTMKTAAKMALALGCTLVPPFLENIEDAED